MKRYESLYQTKNEPWEYSKRAVERIRHERLAELVKQYLQPQKVLLEIGCSKGILSERLLPLTEHFSLLEISPTALSETKKRLYNMEHSGFLEFHEGSALELPFSNNTFQCALAADGIHEWGFTLEQKMQAYSEIYRVLMPGGFAIFSDYLRPEWFSDVKETFSRTSFESVYEEYLGDRPSYQLESWLKALKHFPWVQQVNASLSLAKKLQVVGKKLGPKGSRHMIWIGRKP